MLNESNEELGYVSSARSFGGHAPTTNPDVEDIPSLTRVLESIDAKIELHNSNDALNLRDAVLTVEQQLAVNQQIVAHLRELRLLVETAIEQAKEV